MKLKLIISLLMPLLASAAALLRAKDENASGLDDEAAEAIEFAIARIQKYLV